MTPSVGRIVHYVSHGTPVREDGTQAFLGVCRAAIITEVLGSFSEPDGAECVGLCVLNPTGQFFSQNVPYSPGSPEILRGGTWHWPERV
jgi:hypothetical protein